jgi:hypothetical protein
VLTFLFWRHTRPIYDDYYDDDEVSGPTAIAGLDVVDDGLGPSAYPPDGEPTVVVKPKSELQGDATAVVPAGGGGEVAADEGAGLVGAAAAGAAAGALVQRKRDGATDDPGDPAAQPDHEIDTPDPDVQVADVQVADVQVVDPDLAPVAAAGLVAEHHVSDDLDPYDDGSPLDHEPAPDAELPDGHDAVHDDTALHDVEWHDAELDEAVVVAFDHDGYHDEPDDEGFDATDDHEVVADDPILEPVAPPSPSAVTILGPMRPGTSAEAAESEGRGVTLEPDPLEIVTLEDIERAQATRGRRPSGRGNGSDRNG